MEAYQTLDEITSATRTDDWVKLKQFLNGQRKKWRAGTRPGQDSQVPDFEEWPSP